MIIKSRCIFDGVSPEPYEGYVTIKENKIHSVLKGDSIPVSLRHDEEVLDVGNRTVMAGFCDNHVHIFLAALDLTTCSLRDCESEEEAAKRLADFFKNRKDKWVIGFGWCNYDWANQELPSKETLDKYFGDRPVMLINDELHALWVNSKALELCGIDKYTENPQYGEIYKDEKGEPTGYILEQSAMRLFTDIALDYTEEEEKDLIKAFVKEAHKKGVTSVGDMEIIGIMKSDIYKALECEKELKVRVFFSPSIQKPLDEFIELKENFDSDNLSLLGAKGFIDGTPLGHTGLMIDDYKDMPGFKGEPVLHLAELRNKVEQLNGEGIPVRLHACGDGAVREALDDIEKANHNRGLENVRNTIEHIECLHPDDIGRFAKSGTIASIQPNHMTMNSMEEHPIFDILGEKRSELSWPAKTLSRSGACVALGTDCPIVPLEPMMTLYCAINRVMEDGSPQGGWNPKEKYTVQEALKGVTVNNAHLFKMEDKIGTLESGKYADIVVLSEDIFKKDVLDILDIKVDITVWNGEKVYERKGGEHE